MKRRTFLQTSVMSAMSANLLSAIEPSRCDQAFAIMEGFVKNGTVRAAVVYVAQREQQVVRAFGTADENAMFLLGSISKPIAITSCMTLFDKGAFALDDRVAKFLPDFKGDGRDDVTIRHLLTHASGLPDQLPENDSLRRRHASLVEFADHAVRTPRQFASGTRYQYSSMGILLACRIAEKISGTDIRMLVERQVFEPLTMKRSAQGLGRFGLADFVSVQTEFAAPEAGGGDPSAKDWDWNSAYWRTLGAPWGGAHCSAPDLGRLFRELLRPSGGVLSAETIRLMTTNQNPAGLTPRGLGWNVGSNAGSKGCSVNTFGHTGSTGTLAWADPVSQTICVVLTSLPGRALQPHPRELVADTF